MKAIIIGTSHFVSFSAAAKYYKPYGLNRKDVEAKIMAREIFLGRPKTKDGQTLKVNDEGRYVIYE